MNHTLHIIGKAAWYPPLGLLTIAAMLPSGWTLRLVDLNVDSLSDDDINWSDTVFLSAMNVQEVSARNIIKRCNGFGKTIVAGGSLFTLQYERFTGIDHFVLNEAEITLPLFLADLEAGVPKHIYTSDQYCSIDETPIPAWDLIDLKNYQYGIIQYSRGCPFHCDFCDVPVLYGNNPRTKSPEQVISELNLLLKNSTVPSILFADDNLIGNKKILKRELLPALISWRKQTVPIFSFSTQVSINLADDEELMDLMLEAGFRHLFIGIESDNDETLRETGKSQNMRRNILDNISTLHKKGFIVVGGFIVGFDTDTPETFSSQNDLIQNSGILLATVNLLKAPPGTPLYNRLKTEGRLMNEFSFEESDTNILTKLPSKTLYSEFHKIIRQVYSPEFGVRRAKKWLSEFNPLPHVVTDIPALNSLEYIPVLLRTIFYVGIRYRGRRYFWQLLFWALLNRPRVLDWALIESIFIYQLDHLLKDYSKKLTEKQALLDGEISAD